MLAFHTLFFISFSVGTLGSPLIAVLHPEISPWDFISATGILIIFVVASWVLYKGECPFTVWENTFREQERRGSSYREPCIDHYARKWFGYRFPGTPGVVSTIMLLVFMLVPAITGALRLL
jgi:hypothetical protein